MPRSEHLPLNEVHVEVAVVVVVEQRDARRDDLGVVEPPGHAVDMDEVETGLLRPIDEPGAGHGDGDAPGGRDGAAAGEAERQTQSSKGQSAKGKGKREVVKLTS